nr:unnamed protein product [Digitaria exilis]
MYSQKNGRRENVRREKKKTEGSVDQRERASKLAVSCSFPCGAGAVPRHHQQQPQPTKLESTPPPPSPPPQIPEPKGKEAAEIEAMPPLAACFLPPGSRGLPALPASPDPSGDRAPFFF